MVRTFLLRLACLLLGFDGVLEIQNKISHNLDLIVDDARSAFQMNIFSREYGIQRQLLKP